MAVIFSYLDKRTLKLLNVNKLKSVEQNESDNIAE